MWSPIRRFVTTQQFSTWVTAFCASILALALAASSTQAQVAAGSTLPGATNVEAPLVSPRQAEQILRTRQPSLSGHASLRASSATAFATGTPPEIAELARGLRNDPDLIYEFVYNNIAYAPVFGLRKGPVGTLIDREGNSFDQAALMVALLRESGYTASFVFGTIRIDAAELNNLFGVSSDANAVATLIGSAGIPVSISSSGGIVSHVDKDHVWVKATIDGVDYVFDPAFKTHNWKSGIDLATILGYDRTTFINSAMVGATLDERTEIVGGIEYVVRDIFDVNKPNISSDLAGYATNLIDHVKNDPALNTLEDVIGGEEIVRLPAGTLQRISTLPYQVSVTAEWPEVPAQYKPTLRIQYQGIDQTFFGDEIYGKRLSIFFNTTNEPVLRLDGAQVAVGTVTTPGQETTVTFTVDNPYAALGGTFADQTTTGTLYGGGDYVVVSTFGGSNRGMVERHRRLLGEAKLAGGADESEEVLGEALTVMAFNWLAQNTAVRNVNDRLSGNLTIQHHKVGITGQRNGPFTDIRLNLTSVVDLVDGSLGAENFFSTTGVVSASEGGMLEQIHKGPAGASISMLDIANAQDFRISQVGNFNWFWMKPVLQGTGYPANMVDEMEAYINAGFSVFLPYKTVPTMESAITVDSWTGHTFIAVSSDGLQVAHIVSSAKGGFLGRSITDAQLADNAGRGGLFVPGTDHNSDFSVRAGDPVDLFSGKFTYERSDIAVGSAGFPFGLTLQRSYDSDTRFREDGPLGRGWTHNFNISAILDSDSFQGLGEDSALDATAAIAGLYVSLDLFTQPKTVQIMTIGALAQDWYMDQLVENSVRVTHPGNEQQFIRLADGSFNPPPGEADQLVEEPDGSYLFTNKNGVELDFDSDGKLATWQDPNGVTVTLSYDTNGKLETIDNGLGRTLTLLYTGDQITEVSDGNGRSIIYGYDADGNLTSFADAETHATTYSYTSGAGLLTEVFTPAFPTTAVITNSFDPFGRVKEQRTARNFLWEYFYSGFRTEVVDPLGNAEVREFNRFGRNIRHVDQAGNVSENEFDDQQRLRRTTTAEGSSLEYEYDANHNVVQITANPKPGSPLAPIAQSFLYDQTWNKVVQATDALGRVTDFILDPANGNLDEIREPAVGGVRPTTFFTYNADGQVLTATDPEGKVTRNTYDPATADLLTVTEDDGILNLTTVFGYDSVGNVTSVRDPNGRTTTSLPDKERRVVETVLPAPFSHVAKVDYDEDGRVKKQEQETGDPVTPWQVSSFIYDAAGNRLSATLPGNHTIDYEYDGLDRVKKVTDAEGRITETFYDPRGLVERVEETTDLALGTTQNRVAYTYTDNGLQKTLADANGNTTTYDFDGFDRLARTTYPDSSFEEVTYDANGNVRTRVTRSGATFSYDYDALDRLEREDVPYSLVDLTYGYDLVGRTLTVTDESGTITHNYDTAGRLDTVTRPDGKAIGYDYDANGNRTRLTWPDNWFVTYDYDELNRITDVRQNGTELLAHYDYDALSRRTLLTYGNGTTASYDFDSDDNDLNAIDHSFGSSSFGFSYTYNQNNERIAEIVTDDLYLWRPDGTSNQSYTPNNLNQYGQVGGTTYAYDGNGNLTDDGTNTFTFDAKNRLTQAVNPQNTSTYQYDALDRRIAKTVGTLTTRFLLDGLMEIAEYDGATDALLLRYVYGPGMTAPLVEVSSAGKQRFLHTDAIGSVVAVSGEGSGSGGTPADPQVLNPVTGTPQGADNLTLASFIVPAGDDRVLLVAIDTEISQVAGVTFGGTVMTQVGAVSNGASQVSLYELREAALGAGAQTGDIVVDLNDATGGSVQVIASVLTNIDQSAAPVVAQAFNGGAGQTNIGAAITTTAGSSIVVSALGLGDPETWTPRAGETQIGYEVSAGSAAGGASYELVAAGTHGLSWSGPAAERPTLLLAAYAAAPGGGGSGFAINNPQSGSGSLPGYTVGADSDRVLLVGVATDTIGNSNLDVSFGGTAMSQLQNLNNNSLRTALFELPESALGAGAQTGDITVSVNGSTPSTAEILAFYLTGVDPNELARQRTSNTVLFCTSDSRSIDITTNTPNTAVVSTFSVNVTDTWAPGADETTIVYNVSGGNTVAASYEVAPTSGTLVNMSWTGPAPARPTIIAATYGLLAPAGGGGGGGGFATPGVTGAQTASSLGDPDVKLASYGVPAGADRALLVAVANEGGTISGVSFGGTALSQVGQVANGANEVALYELREAALGGGVQNGDILVQVTGAAGDGKATQVTAFTVAGVDQAATPVLGQASSPGTAETAIAASLTTNAEKSLLVGAFGLGDQITWIPGSGETQAGYAASGSAAGGVSSEVAGPGTQEMSWSGAAAGRPTLLVATYPAKPASGGGGGGGSGDVVERYAYGPHGEGLEAGFGTIAFRYAGQRYDDESGLIYMRARYYSVALGRFLSPDPIGYADGFNLYSYAANSPLNFIDPMGLAGQFAAQGLEGLTPISAATLNAWRPGCLADCNVFKAAGLQGESIQLPKQDPRLIEVADLEADRKYHNELVKIAVKSLRAAGAVVETEITFRSIDHGYEAIADALAMFPGSSPAIIEVKSGYDPLYSPGQSVIYPLSMIGNHIYSTSPKIQKFGFGIGEPLPAMYVFEVYADKRGRISIKNLPIEAFVE